MAIKILLVDDHVLSQKYAVFVLRPHGCEVEIAPTATEALSLLEKKKYDMLFVDYGLPDMKGPQLSKKIRAIAGCETVPIIALSAHSPRMFELDYEKECLEAGMNMYITKPLEKEQVFALFKRFLADKLMP